MIQSFGVQVIWRPVSNIDEQIDNRQHFKMSKGVANFIFLIC